jgi:ComF family protein
MHTGPLRQAIIHYKYSNRRDLAPTLAAELARRLDNEYARPKRLPLDEVVAIVPVVLHPLRRAWRGFDQAQALARSLSELTGKPLWDDTLARVKDTTPQVSLSPGQRAENMRGAFEARKGWKLAGATLLLVDDVYTTGATLRAAARALKDAGAARVFGLTITRAAPQWHPDSFASLTEP